MLIPSSLTKLPAIVRSCAERRGYGKEAWAEAAAGVLELIWCSEEMMFERRILARLFM